MESRLLGFPCFPYTGISMARFSVEAPFGNVEICHHCSCELRYHDLFSIIELMPTRSYLGEFELMILLAVINLGEEAYG
ncbi:MAG: hypothetical protein WCC26_09220, partial [Terracidiphilus sp.]